MEHFLQTFERRSKDVRKMFEHRMKGVQKVFKDQIILINSYSNRAQKKTGVKTSRLFL